VPAANLPDLYQVLLTGNLKLGILDRSPGDQYYDFTMGLAGDVLDVPLFPPTILTLTANPPSVSAGCGASGQVTISWITDKATSVDITGVGTGLPPNGSQQVTINANTTFTATAHGASAADGTATKSVSVAFQSPTPAIVSFTATPTSVAGTQQVTLAWTSQNATSVTIDKIGSNLPANGSQSVSVSATTTFKATAMSSCGASTPVQVTVNWARSISLGKSQESSFPRGGPRLGSAPLTCRGIGASQSSFQSKKPPLTLSAAK
jgi:hypothetical protein